MRTHEFAESIQHGLRLPTAEQVRAAQRAMPDDRAERQGKETTRRRAARQPHKPHRYGAGF